MKLIDLNRHGEIGANSMFVQIGSFNILIDSGLNPKKLGYDALPDFEPIEKIDLDLIVLTHCHLDHLGVAWDQSRGFGVQKADRFVLHVFLCFG